MKAKQINRSTQPRLKKISMSLLLILGSAPAWALQTNIGTTCGATGTITCTAGTQNNVTVDGSAVSTEIQTTVVWQGGEVNNNTVLSTGKLTLNAGAVANGTVLQSTGVGGFTISAGGTANDTTLTSGQMRIDGVNAKANNTIVNGGTLTIAGHGTAIGSMLNAGTSYVTDYGTVVDNTIGNGATQNLYGSSVADGTIIKNGGSQKSYESGTTGNVKGATLKNTTIEAGGLQTATGASSIVEHSTVYGSQQIGSGASVSDTKVYDGGIQYVYAGGVGVDTIIYQGGKQSVQSAGVVTDTIINSGGMQLVTGVNSTVINSRVNAGGYLQLGDGTKSTGGLNVYGDGVAQITAGVTQGAYIEQVSLNDQASILRFYNPGVDGQIVTVDNLTNNGIVTFQHSANTGYTVANVKNLSGNGLVQMRVEGLAGDFLNVTDSVTGKQAVQILDSGQDIDSTGYHLISATGSTNDNFALKNGVAELGTYRYVLLRDDPANPDSWFLRTAPEKPLSNAAESIISMANVTPTIWDSELTTLRARLGEMRDGATVNHNAGVWAKATASRYNVSTDNVGYKQDTNGVVVGGDRVFAADNGQFLLGGMFSYSRSDIDYRTAGDGTVDSYSAGIYGTYLLNNGYYIDGVFKANQFKTENNVVTNLGNRLNGSNNTTGFGVSVEGGKYIKINDYFIEPYAMLSVFRGESSEYKLSNGLKAQADATESVKAEAGLTFGKAFTQANGVIIKPYVRLAVSHEFQDSNELTLNDTERFNNDMSGTVGKVGLGLNAQLTGAWSAFAEVNYANGDHVESPYNGHLGVRYSF